MSRISMQNVSVMTVQYWHYSFEYVLDSIEKCGLKYLELWAGAPHYTLMTIRPSQRQPKIAKMRRQIEDRGMKVIMLTPEQLNYPFNLAGREEEYRQKHSQRRPIDGRRVGVWYQPPLCHPGLGSAG